MHIVTGLIVGSALGILAGFAAVQYTTPPSIAVQANKTPELAIPVTRSWNI